MPDSRRTLHCYASEGEACSDDSTRWECAQIAGWIDALGKESWEQLGLSALQFLSTASAEELAELADRAAENLACGAWEGFPTPTGGWAERDPEFDQWHAVAADFMARYAEGDRYLTEGLIAGATYDLACELAHLRGWCPDYTR